jgi:flagellar motor switch protein FliM
VELDPSPIFPILEMLPGATLKSPSSMQRDLTEIGQKLLDGHFRVILQDLREAWEAVTPIDFTVEAMETGPQLLQPLAPNQAVVSVGVEVRLGETMEMRNIDMTSIVIKMMRLKFDQQWPMRKSRADQADQSRMLRRLRQASLGLEAPCMGT